MTIDEAIYFLEQECNILDPDLLTDYIKMTRWALTIENHPIG